MYQSLQPFLKFNERGEIYKEDGSLVPYSRLEDLVQYAVRDRRRSVVPAGWPEFRYMLQMQNVPKYMLNRDTLEEMTSVKEEPTTTPTLTPLKIKPHASSVNTSPARGRSRSKVRRILSASDLRKRSVSKGRKKVKSIPTKIPTPAKQNGQRARKANLKYETFGFVKHY